MYDDFFHTYYWLDLISYQKYPSQNPAVGCSWYILRFISSCDLMTDAASPTCRSPLQLWVRFPAVISSVLLSWEIEDGCKLLDVVGSILLISMNWWDCRYVHLTKWFLDFIFFTKANMTLLFVNVCLHVVLLGIGEHLRWYLIPKPGLLVSKPEKNWRTHNYIPCVAMSKHVGVNECI